MINADDGCGAVPAVRAKVKAGRTGAEPLDMKYLLEGWLADNAARMRISGYSGSVVSGRRRWGWSIGEGKLEEPCAFSEGNHCECRSTSPGPPQILLQVSAQPVMRACR